MTNSNSINQYQHQQEKNEVNQSHDQDYDNNIMYHAAGRVPRFLSPEDGERIRDEYLDNIGPMTSAAANMIENFFAEGIEVEEIIMAIHDTGLASRPSAYYLRAILQNWITQGVTRSRAHNYSTINRWWEDTHRQPA